MRNAHSFHDESLERDLIFHAFSHLYNRDLPLTIRDQLLFWVLQLRPAKLRTIQVLVIDDEDIMQSELRDSLINSYHSILELKYLFDRTQDETLVFPSPYPVTIFSVYAAKHGYGFHSDTPTSYLTMIASGAEDSSRCSTSATSGRKRLFNASPIQFMDCRYMADRPHNAGRLGCL